MMILAVALNGNSPLRVTLVICDGGLVTITMESHSLTGIRSVKTFQLARRDLPKRVPNLDDRSIVSYGIPRKLDGPAHVPRTLIAAARHTPFPQCPQRFGDAALQTLKHARPEYTSRLARVAVARSFF
jgi:hypothetical protein